ncbi:MAG: NAD(P)-binding domain-containing protein [Rhizobiaceae bacterium]|nr:NAD(P)-binding domain-containing protein [Rhizobiaceae bacterium]
MITILKAAPGLDSHNNIKQALGEGYEVLEYDPSRSLQEQGRHAAVFLLRDVPVSADILDACRNLKLLQRLGHHLVGVDIKAARQRGIRVAAIPARVSGGDRMVAEHALFLIMAVAKRARENLKHVQDRMLGKVEAVSLAGKTLGLIGLGNTGTELARLVAGLGMKVMTVKRTIDRRAEKDLGLSFMGDFSSMDHVLSQSDFVSLHLPLEANTVGMIGQRELGMMKRSAYLINISRASIVDKAALTEALETGRIAGAGLDVFWEEPADPQDPLLKHPNVFLTPHNAGITKEVKAKLTEVAVGNIRRVLAGEAPEYEVTNAPTDGGKQGEIDA